MTREIDWFVDYVSPYPYLQLARFDEFPDDVVVRPRPVLFAGLLNHWGHKGPAEIKAKARHLDHYCRWAARKRGLADALAENRVATRAVEEANRLKRELRLVRAALSAYDKRGVAMGATLIAVVLAAVALIVTIRMVT